MDKNLFSYWFPLVKDCGIKVPASWVVPIPNDILIALIEECEQSIGTEKAKQLDSWFLENIKPIFYKQGMLFNKDGLFSNKFSFNTCISREDNVREHMREIIYADLCFDVGGCSEFVFREIIDYDRENTPCIYNGLPLRSEFRVFYDFDTKEVLKVANYWDFGYCYNQMYFATDKIILEHEREKLEKAFDEHKQAVSDLVVDKMQNVELEGKWSVDLLLDEEGTYWLIDMAAAERSAYWNGGE